MTTTITDTTIATGGLTGADLEDLRTHADPLADAAVAGFFATVDAAEPNALFGALARHTTMPAEEQVPAVRAFFEEAGVLPSWVDQGRLASGQEFFNEWAAHHFTAMYLASLPTAYAAAKGVQVLNLTARLRTDTERRLNETAQFLMDTSAPGAFAPGGVGISRVLHIRLMHAAVRHLIEHDPVVRRVEDVEPPRSGSTTDPDTGLWSASWGRPANQEDLLGTMLTFTTVVYEVFDATGVEYTADQVEDHLYFWRVIAHLLGIDPAIVPTGRAEADRLQRLIWERQHAPSAAGVAMTAALLGQAQERLPRMMWAFIPTAMRRFNGDDVCDMIGVPAANWTRILFGPLAELTRVMTFGRRHNAVLRWIGERTGRAMINALLDVTRGGERPTFSIPTHLDPALGRT
ncbi:MAG: oxygenase MpaB family protein [Actinomycetota bacterium]